MEINTMDDAQQPPDASGSGGIDGLGFEEALGRLGRVVEALEGGELGLDAALVRYEEGVRLLGRLRTLLDGAERRVALLVAVDETGTPATEPFDARATASRSESPLLPGTTASDDADDDDAPF